MKKVDQIKVERMTQKRSCGFTEDVPFELKLK